MALILDSRQVATQSSNPQSPFSHRGIAKSVLSNWFGLAANILVAFFLAPFVVHHLGDTAYGIWALVLQLTGYMGAVDVGLRSALVRFVSRFRAKGEEQALDQLLSTTLLIYGSLAIGCLLVGFLLAAFVLPFFHIPFILLSEARITLVLAAAILASDFLFATFQATLAGMSRWDLRNGVGVGVLLVRSLLVVVFLLAGYGLIALALIQLLTSLLGHVAEVLLVRGLLPNLRISRRLLRRDILRPVLSHSTHSFLISLSGAINYEVDTIVIAAFLPVEQVTLYVIGSRLAFHLRLLVNGATMIVSPMASELDAQGRGQEMGQLLTRGSKYVLLLAYLGTAAMLCLGPDFIRIWMGAAYGPSSGKILTILAWAQFAALTELMAAHLLYGLGKHQVNTWCTMGEAVLNLGASLALVHRFGIYGVAAGTTLAALFVRGWIFPSAFLKIFQVSWAHYLQSSIFPTILPTLAFACGALLTRRLVPIGGYGTLCLAAAGGMVLFLPSLWVSGLNGEERTRLLVYLRGFRSKLTPSTPAPVNPGQ